MLRPGQAISLLCLLRSMKRFEAEAFWQLSHLLEFVSTADENMEHTAENSGGHVVYSQGRTQHWTVLFNTLYALCADLGLVASCMTIARIQKVFDQPNPNFSAIQ